MGFLSKVWKGVKKVVKKVAKGVKKIAKGVTTSLPGGQKLWKASGKLGTSIMKGFSKVVGKLGPIGMMALSLVLTATGVGAPIAAMLQGLWGSFGVGAATMAASGNAFVAAIGNVGTGIFTAGNFIGGTLGKMGEALSKGAAQVVKGNFGDALTTFSTNMGQALSGEAGTAAVSQASSLAGQGFSTLAEKEAFLSVAGTTGPQSLSTVPQFDAGSLIDSPINTGPQSATSVPSFGDQLADATRLGGESGFSAETVRTTLGTQETLGEKALSAGKEIAKSALKSTAKSLLSPGQGAGQELQIQPFQSNLGRPLTSAVPGSGGGVGSEGFSLLSGVRGLEESVRNSQRLLFS